MRTRVIAAIAVVAALVVPGAALADPAGPTGAAPVSAASVPAGSLWVVASAPACRSVTTPPEAPAGESPILVGAPGGRDQFCGGYARIGAGGSLSLPGGVPGEWLTPAAYARVTGQTVTVVYRPAGGVVVYLPA
jgi:hypothetical protein